MMKAVCCAAIAVALMATGAQGAEQTTCTGTLIDVDTRAKADWPLAVIYDEDEDGHHVCTVDRSGARHDPLRPCSAGERCRVVGTFRKIGQTYAIQSIISVDRVQE